MAWWKCVAGEDGFGDGFRRRLLPVMVVASLVMLSLVPYPGWAETKEKQARSALGIAAMDFKTCTEFALKHSPYLTKTALEIDIRRLDESDSRWSFVPTLSVSTYTYSKGTSLSVGTTEYNPLQSYFSLKAQKLVTRIAILSHLKAISQGVYEIGQKFLQLGALQRMDAVQSQIVSIAQQKVAYINSRKAAGTASPLEAQIADQELKLARAEREGIAASLGLVVDGLRVLLGLESMRKSELRLEQVSGQVLGDFNPSTATLKEPLGHSFLIKIQELKKELQTLNIKLAYAKFMPSFQFNVRNADVLTADDTDEYYFGGGIRLLVWDGLSRFRNITRQKMVLRQFESESKTLLNDVSIQWQTAKGQLRNAESALKVARSAEVLAQTRVRQSEIRYNADGQNLPVLLDHRIAYNRTRKATHLKTRDHQLAVLRMRHLSGDLFKSHVNVEQWKE
jgi:outer membrane protein TolC